MKDSCEDREIDMVQATCGLINLALKDRYKTGDKLTGFGAIDFGNMSAIRGQIQDTFNYYLFILWGPRDINLEDSSICSYMYL